ncbi:plasmid mobilization relaxosome protein MobC [Pedobacter frigiditerrae]|uniref:plasmid mobilization relaxosome protein MobC n=1 Tax=Pedobacter frigiditerrae TaxID=2530452 RepID=UPI00292DD2AD|nr:plasmid mobilization relaxosome protein MobC [Pedobacter frigiditerrae]
MGNSHPARERALAPKIRRFELRLSDQEMMQFLELEKSLGISRSDIVRIRVLKNAVNMLTNTKELMKKLDAIGAELGRSGNNINQLAKHANILQKQGLLNQSVATEFASLLGGYVTVQQELEKNIRQIIRLMKGQL